MFFVWNILSEASYVFRAPLVTWGIIQSITMLRSYFRIALRHLRKGGSFSAINIFGLAIGLAVCLMITLFVTDEFSYDRYNDKADRIYRIVSDLHVNGNGINGIAVPSPMGPALVMDYPSIEKAVRVRYQDRGEMWVRKGPEKVMESNAVFADSTLFDVFSLPMIAGNPHKALVEPYSMVISERIARKYFSGTDVLGKTLVTDDTTTYTITGVIRDMPAPSHFHFDFIRSMSEKKFNGGGRWINLFSATYLVAKPGVTTGDIDRMLAATVTKYIGPQLQNEMHSSLTDMAKNGDYWGFYSIPLTRIHLYSNVTGEFEPNGNIQLVYVFMIIAVFLLLIACSNFMNLSTARSADRSREIGVRKVLGSSRRDLIVQFLGESILTGCGVVRLGILIAALLFPYFNQLSGKHIVLNVLGKKWIAFALLLSPLVVGLLAGSYPALYLSAFQPIQVLKGRLSTGFKSSRLRNSLVVFQFSAAIALIIGTLVIYSQLNYIRSRDLGFNRDQVLTIHNTNNLGTGANAFKEEVEKLPGISGGTMTSDLPNKAYYISRGYFNHVTAKASETVLLGSWQIEANYIPLLGMKVIRGRNFSPVMPTDSSGVLINETAARLLGYTDPINKSLYTGPNPVTAFHILGVVKDFNAGTMHKKIEPIVFHLADDNRAISFRINTRNIPGLIAQIKELYQSMGGQAFNYSFMDDDFNKLYQSDERTGKIFISFALLAVFIACLGLFVLATYAADQRTKEIGIRSRLGATVRDITGLLSKDFLKLVFLAILIACPIAWWAMHQWLEDFAYRTVISWWDFVLAGAMVLAITILTVGWRAVKAGMVTTAERLMAE